MADKPLHYVLSIGGDTYMADRVRGREAYSEPRRFEVELTIPSGDTLDPELVTGGEASLILRRRNDERTITFVVSEVRRLAVREEDATGSRVSLVLESRLAWLRHRKDQRVFRDKDVPTIVAEVCAGLGVKIERRLADSYAVRPYTVQHAESDFNFVSRLLEDEGIFYVVGDDDTVIIGDSPNAYEGAAPLPTRQRTGLDRNEDAVFDLGFRGTLGAGSVTVRDFDFERPSLDVVATSPVPFAIPGGPEWYQYPSARTTPSGAEKKARLLAEAFACSRDRLVGRTLAASLRPGHSVLLVETPDGIETREYAIAVVTHDFSRTKAGFSNAFEALAADRTLRPEPQTPIPRASAPITGYVAGPAGEDIYTDKWGRSKIHFPWDRLQPKDDNCSDWVPTLQDNTGRSSSLPRIGWEMLVHFLEGDPDRPIVMGRVYNALDPNLAVLPEMKTNTSIRSLTSPRSTKGATGENRITFEDKAGIQAIFMQAERDRTVVVANDKSVTTQNTDGRVVHGNEAITVGAERKITVGANRSSDVTDNHVSTIGANRSIDVGKNNAEGVTNNRTVTIGGSYIRRIGTSDTVNTEINHSEKIGALVLEASVKDNSLSADLLSLTMVGGAMVQVAKDAYSQNAGKVRAEAVGGLLFTKAKKLVATGVGKSRKTFVGGAYKVKAGEDVLVTGQAELAVSALSAALEGSVKATLKVQDSTLLLEKGLLSFDTKKIVITTQDHNTLAAVDSKQND